jgi:3-hydroxybutyryl-CoA dehydratase
VGKSFKLILLHNEHGKLGCNPTLPYYAFQRSDVRSYDSRQQKNAGRRKHDGPSGTLRDRLLERRQFAESLGRHRSRRAAQDHSLHADAGCALYCKAVGEDHPIYFDEAYARTTRYGGLIAPPSIHILLMFACTPADDWMRSPGTVNAGQSWSYNIPARPGDLITLQARALDKFIKRERLFVVHDNVFFNQNGDVICSGRGWTIRPM